MSNDLTRREMISGAAGLIASLHAPTLAMPQGKIKPKTFIKSVRLQTSTDLKEMEDFYRKNFGFATESLSKTELCLVAGGSLLKFAKIDIEGEGPMTHFAFNIPQNMIRSALEFTKKRIEVNMPGPRECAVDYPKEIYHFHHWNAHSVFFWDPAFNLVEFIARHDLDNDAKGEFGPKHIHCISEIAFGTKDTSAHAYMQKELSVPTYPVGAPAGVLGDQNGLLLCFGVGRSWGKRTLQVQKTEVEIAGPKAKTIQVPDHPFTITVSA